MKTIMFFLKEKFFTRSAAQFMSSRFIFLIMTLGVIASFSAESMAGDQSASASNLRVVAYYPQWAVCDMPPQKIDYSALTHLIYFWGEPTTSAPYFSLVAGSGDSTTFEQGTPGWCLNPLDNGSNGITHQKILRDSCNAHGVKLILCVGGEWGNNASVFSQIVADPSTGGKQDQFIQAALGFAKRHGYAGIDINWEFPDNSATGRANFDAFCNKVRAQLNTWSPKGLFTMAMPTWFWYSHSNSSGPVVNVSTVNNDFDFVDLEMYGMENTTQVSFYSPIYANSAVNSETWDFRGPNEWIGAGVLPSKIVTLIPFECLKMSAASSAIGSPASGPQWIGLRDIPSSVLANPLWDNISKSSYGWSGGNEYLFETQQSLNEKIKYVQAKGIGGVGIWELWRGWLPGAAAGQQDPLLKALKSAVGGVVVIPPPLDVISPVVSITSPSNSAIVSGSVAVSATASDNVGVTKIEFYINGVLGASDAVSPYTFAWNTSGLSGNQAIVAKAYDAAGNIGTSTPVTTVVTVSTNAADLWLYQEGLQLPWINASWSEVITFNSTEQYSSSPNSVKCVAGAWGALRFHSGTWGIPVHVDPSLYTKIEFMVYTVTSPLSLRMSFANDAQGSFAYINYDNVRVNQWVTISYPMSQLNPNNLPIDQFTIQNNTGSSQTLYIDNVRFVSSQSAAAAPVLQSPVNNSTGSAGNPVLTWGTVPSAATYRVQISTDQLFGSTFVDDSTVTGTSKQAGPLANNTKYFWRVNAKNSAGTSAYSSVWNFTTQTGQSDIVKPVVAITSPVDGSSVSGSVALSASASDNVGVIKVEFYVNGTLAGSDAVSPYNYTWSTSGLSGSQSIVAKAYDAAGNIGISPPIVVAIDQWLYLNGLQSPWRDTSWNSTNTFGSTEQVYATPFSLKAVQIAWGAVSLRSGPLGSGVNVAAALYSKFEFAVYNLTSGLALNIYFENDLGQSFTAVLQSNVPVNQWTVISIPMAQLNPGNFVIHRVNIQNFTRLKPTYYLANMRFVGVGGSGSAPATIAVGDSSAAQSASHVSVGADGAGTPVAFELHQNYPNPFNPTTKFTYDLTRETRVSLKVYNIIGQEVATLVNEIQSSGYKSVTFDATNLASGAYYYRLQTDNFTAVKKMMIMK
jgi:hypothetical protein